MVDRFALPFLFQGAVYYHLMVCVVLVLLGYKKDKPLRTLIFVLLASVWAGHQPGELDAGAWLVGGRALPA